MKDILLRYSSRKFWVVVAAFVLTVKYPDQSQVFLALAGIYCTAEGARDVVHSFAEQKTIQVAKDLSAGLLQQNITPPQDFDSPRPATTPPPAGGSTFVPGQ